MTLAARYIACFMMNRYFMDTRRGGRWTKAPRHRKDESRKHERTPRMIVFGIVLFVIGLVASIAILKTIGILLIVVGVVLFALGSMGRAVGGRKHYY